MHRLLAGRSGVGSGGDKFLQFSFQATLVLSLALPNDENAPVFPPKSALINSISVYVTTKFVLPELYVGRRRGCSPAAGMSMPKTAVYKNRRTIFW